MRKKIVQGLLIVLGVLLLGVVGLVGYVTYDIQAGTAASTVTNTEFVADDGARVGAYLAQPADDGTPRPAVLMIHEWWGINHELTELADLLAAQGYVVFAPDTYRGPVADSIPGALYLRINVDTARVDRDMLAAFAYVAALPNVDPSRISMIGFCYGGGVALRHGVINPQIAAVVNLYGDTISDPTLFGALATSGAPVLGIFGGADRQIPVSEAQAFEGALQQANIPHTVTIYDGMDHAFVQPSAIAAGGAAAEAWAQIIAFLESVGA
jgi:carboxymethylenebutenolidase